MKYKVKITGFKFGVPVPFIVYNYNAEQFELIGATESEGVGFSAGIWTNSSKVKQATISGEKVYKRIFIKNK